MAKIKVIYLRDNTGARHLQNALQEYTQAAGLDFSVLDGPINATLYGVKSLPAAALVVSEGSAHKILDTIQPITSVGQLSAGLTANGLVDSELGNYYTTSTSRKNWSSVWWIGGFILIAIAIYFIIKKTNWI